MGHFLWAVRTACKQMGFYGIVTYDPWYMASKKVPSAEPDTPITISSTFCSLKGDAHHVLRCGYSTDVPPSCKHTADIVVGCTRCHFGSTLMKWKCDSTKAAIFFLWNFRDLPQPCVGKYLLQCFYNDVC